MATAAIKIKLMPESVETDLEKIKKESKEKLESQIEKALLHSFEEQPIAFGLKALIALVVWPEEKETSLLEDLFKSIEGISQVDIIDYRRAVG
jgi:translation elongation factor aEF-1 beta